MNESKVLPSRITCFKESGGKVELLLLTNELKEDDESIKAASDRKIEVGKTLTWAKKYKFQIVKQEEQFFFLKPNFAWKHLPDLLKKFGATPIPKYIKNSPLTEKEKRKKYQSLFAKNPGSIAAPTASLHFTNRVFRTLDEKKIPRVFVNLHVGMGTFAPVREENLKSGRLHKEQYEIEKKSAEKILDYKKKERFCVAVGSTSARTLETFAKNKTLRGSTDIFIHPPYKFKMVDGLITNFHVPNSSLMMMVDAFLEFKGAEKSLKDLYEIALKEDFRFYSFGDAMLIV